MALFSKVILDQRYAKIAPYIKGDVLELGCGHAQILAKYGSNIATYCGVERSAKLVEQLSQKYPRMSFVQCDLDRDQLAMNRAFDCVLMIALIEHLF